MKEEKPYLPKERTDYISEDVKNKNFSKSHGSTFMPNPALDPIVANNIAWQEFDYTEDPLDREDE